MSDARDKLTDSESSSPHWLSSQGQSQPRPSFGGGGPQLGDLERQARALILNKLRTIAEAHVGYSAMVDEFYLGASSIRFKLKISGPSIWNKTKDATDALAQRVADTLASKYGGHVEVTVSEGSITLAVILSAIDAAQVVFQLVNSIHTIAEYVVRCVEQSRYEWPPIAAMFTFLESLKRIFLGV